VSHSIIYVPPQAEAFLYIHTLAHSLPQRETPPNHLCQEDFQYKEPVEPFVEPSTLIPLLSQSIYTIQVSWISYFTENLKTLNLWVFSLIKCSISTFLNNIGLNSPHTYHGNKVVSNSISTLSKY
jgi:hypothetical protein